MKTPLVRVEIHWVMTQFENAMLALTLNTMFKMVWGSLN
jgi:hypothetical protein